MALQWIYFICVQLNISEHSFFDFKEINVQFIIIKIILEISFSDEDEDDDEAEEEEENQLVWTHN